MNLWLITTFWFESMTHPVDCLECECLHVNIKIPNESFQCLVWIKIGLIKIICTVLTWRRNWNCPCKCIQYALFISNIHKFTCVVAHIFLIWHTWRCQAVTVTKKPARRRKNQENISKYVYHIQQWYVHPHSFTYTCMLCCSTMNVNALSVDGLSKFSFFLINLDLAVWLHCAYHILPLRSFQMLRFCVNVG